jgi:predicted HTH transcriptional regulator
LSELEVREVASLTSTVKRDRLYVEVMTGPSALALAETLVAFANTDGGTVLLGVDAGGEVTGELQMEDVDSLLRAPSCGQISNASRTAGGLLSPSPSLAVWTCTAS